MMEEMEMGMEEMDQPLAPPMVGLGDLMNRDDGDDGDDDAGGLRPLFYDEVLLSQVCSFLSLRDMKVLRTTSRACNSVVCKSEMRRELSHAEMSASWHLKCKGMDRTTSLTWKYFTLRRFRFYRYSNIFKVYWHHVALNLTHLTMSDSSLECDGFSWILNYVPNLQTLVLKNTKLRDFTYQHNARRVFPHNWEQAGEFPVALRSIVLENTSNVEACFTDYLAHRTGSLVSFTLAKCYLRNEKDSVEDQRSLGARFRTFQPGLAHLLRQNAATLKNLTLKENAAQGSYFQLLMQINEPIILLRELHIVFPKEDYNPVLNVNNAPETYYDTLVTYLTQRGRELRVLSLEFNRLFRNAELDRILVPVRRSLVSLSIIFYGDLLDNEVEFESLIEMINLETFEIRDLKKLDAKTLKKVRGERNPVQKVQLLNPLVSKVSSNFVGRFPYSVTSVSIGNLINQEGLFATLTEPEMIRASVTFMNLTKFEFFGPWIREARPLVDCVVNGMPQLKTLALTNCMLYDMDITGLSRIAVTEIRKSMDHLYGALAPQGAPEAGEYFQLALNHIQVPDGGAPRRPLLSRLAALEHLNLSQNRISDVSFHESLNIPKLKTLNVSFCSRLNNSALELISRNLPELEDLNLRYVRKITKYGINRVISSCKKLRRLYTTPKILEAEDGFLTLDDLSQNFYDVARFKCPNSETEEKENEEAEGELDENDE